MKVPEGDDSSPRFSCPRPITFPSLLFLSQDGYDTIDFTANEIPRLENFPLMRRLGTLLLANNLVSRVSSDLSASLPALHSIVLTNNRIASLVEIDALSSLSSLRKLSLLHNPVTRRPHYRSYCIFRLPQLTELDFQAVKRKEKVAAIKLFSSSTGQALLKDLDAIRAAQHPEIASLPSLLGKKAVGSAAAAAAAGAGDAAVGAGSSSSSSSSLSSAAGAGGGGSGGFAEAQKQAIAAALAAATTAAEFAEIEDYLKRNELPPAALRLLTGGDAPVPLS